MDALGSNIIRKACFPVEKTNKQKPKSFLPFFQNKSKNYIYV